MLRFVSAVIVFAFIAFVLAAGTGPAASARAPAVQGDTDCDGAVAKPDLIRVLTDLGGLDDETDCDASATDVNCSGETDVEDALDILYYLDEIPDATPAPGCAGVGSPAVTQTTPAQTALTTEPVTPASLTPTPPFVTPTPVTTPPPSVTPTPLPPCLTGTPAPTLSPAPTASPGFAAPIADSYDVQAVFPDLPSDDPQTDWSFRQTSMVMVPNEANEAIITQQDGRIYHVTVDGAIQQNDDSHQQIGDISDRVTRKDPTTDDGLMSAAFDPQDPDRLYVTYTTGTNYVIPGQPLPLDPKLNRLSWFKLVNGMLDVDHEHVLLDIPDPHPDHNMDLLMFGPDGYLYISQGEGGGSNGQFNNNPDASNLLGTVLRIHPNGQGYDIPSDNPFADGPGGCADEIWAYGFRNPWRFAFDPDSGLIWEGDVGANKWEEVNIVQKGGNYGWKIMEGYACTDIVPCDKTGLILPRAVYPHDGRCAIIGGFVYQGTAMPELDGWFVYGDYCTGRIYAVDTHHSGDPVELVNTTIEIVSFAELPSGELLVLGKEGGISRLVP